MEGGGSLHFLRQTQAASIFYAPFAKFSGRLSRRFFPACGSEDKKLYGAEKIFFADFKLAAR